MPARTSTRVVPPVARVHLSPRRRLLRRVLAVGAFAVFVAGMLAASGYGELVLAAAPFVAAGIAARVVLALLRRLRPWRILPPAGRGIARALATVLRGIARALATVLRGLTRALAATAGAAVVAARALVRAGRGVLPKARAGARRGSHWLARPREPWRPPAPVVGTIGRARLALAASIDRTVQPRQKAHASWQTAAAAGTERAFALGGRVRQRMVSASARRRARRTDTVSLGSTAEPE